MANGAGAVGGGGFNVGELFKNPLFLQYLSGAGGALAQGESIAPTLNKITQQNIAATSKAKLQQNYMQMLQGMLKGGGKITLDKDNINIKASRSALAGDDETGMSMGLPEQGLLGFVEDQPPRRQSSAEILMEGGGGYTGVKPGGGEIINPSAGPSDASVGQVGQISPGALSEITSADVAGLTPQDVSQALSGAISTENLRSSVGYRQALAEESRARAGQIGRPGELDQQFPIQVPGVGNVSLRQWKTLPTDDKAYASYVHLATKSGEEVLSRDEWQKKLDRPERAQYLDVLMEEPEMRALELDLRRSGATRISVGERVETAEALADVKARKYINDPKGLVADIDKHLKSKTTASKIRRAGVENRPTATAREAITFIENKIRASKGEVSDVQWEGDVITWSITYPNGDTEEFSHAVGPRPTQ